MTEIRTILFPTDLSDCAEGAFSHAAFLAERLGATLHILHVREDPDYTPPDWTDALRITADDVAADLGLPPEASGDGSAPLTTGSASPVPDFGLVRVEHHEMEAPDVPAAILHCAAEVEADLIVMGTHGRTGLRRAVMGSVAEAVVRHARSPVFTVRPTVASGDRARGAWALRRVLVAVERAAPRPPQVAWAARLAQAYGARLDLLRTVPASLLAPGETASGRIAHRELREMEEALCAETGLRVASRVAEGDPADAIVDTAAATGADLVVVGSHGREGVRRALLGSVSERVVRQAPCPVFVARRVPVEA